MPIRSFEPRAMPIGVLTAALQELTPRQRRDADPDLAIEDWLAFARELGADCIQLSAALHPSQSDVPAEAMLDPVANTLDLRAPFSRERAARAATAVKETGVAIADLGYFDNLLHEDAATRRRKHDFMLRVFDAAVLLGAPAVCGFVGRNQKLSMDENLVDFEASFVPLLREAKARGSVPHRAVPDAGLDGARRLPQQPRVYARHVDGAAPHLRTPRRRRPAAHPL
jgi:sugar phosphate isomerase/epimerase